MRSRSEQRSAALHAARWAARPRTRIAPLQPNPGFANPSGATAPRTGLCGTGGKAPRSLPLRAGAAPRCQQGAPRCAGMRSCVTAPGSGSRSCRPRFERGEPALLIAGCEICPSAAPTVRLLEGCGAALCALR